MSFSIKFADEQALARLWERIKQRYDKKLDSVTNYDSTVEVHSGREISARVSSHKGNLLKVDNGLLVEPLKTLKFGDYKYDGTEDVNVTVYNGEYQDE